MALRRGRLDIVESLAEALVRHRWEGISQSARTHSGVVLTTIRPGWEQLHSLEKPSRRAYLER